MPTRWALSVNKDGKKLQQKKKLMHTGNISGETCDKVLSHFKKYRWMAFTINDRR